MKIHDGALKHGVLPEDAVQAADWPLCVEPLDEVDWPHRELRLGLDTQARLLETVVLVFESGAEMVIHAMPARTQYWIFSPEPDGFRHPKRSPRGSDGGMIVAE